MPRNARLLLLLLIPCLGFADEPSMAMRGNPQGDVTIIEFFDYQCPHCKITEEGIQQLVAADPHLRIVYKDYAKLGPLSTTAAEAALASLQQGVDRYLALHDIMMKKDFQMSEEAIYTAAAQAGVDVDRMKKDMASPEIAAKLQANIDFGKSMGVSIVPSYVVGTKHSYKLYIGEASYAHLKEIVDYTRSTSK